MQIYTGNYILPNARGIVESDQYLDALQTGVFVAVNISNYNKFPVIGKVTEVNENDFNLEYWQGSYSKSWRPHLVTVNKEKLPWSDKLPKSSVILCNFDLIENGMLQESTRKFLKRWKQQNRAKDK